MSNYIMETEIEILQVHYKIMGAFKLASRDGKKFAATEKPRIALLLLFFTFVCYGISYHLIKNKQRNTISLEEIIDDVVDIIAFSGMLLLVVIGIKSNENARGFLQSLGDFSEFGKPPRVEELNRKLNVFTAVYTGYAFLGTWIYYVFKITLDKSCEENNVRFNKSDMCRTLTSALLPYELEPPFDNIFRLTQIISVGTCASLACTFVAFPVSCSEFIIIRISHLKDALENALADKDRVKSNGKLRFCVEYHNHIISLVDKFNAIFERHLALIFTQNGPLISLIGFRFILKPNGSLVIHIFAWLVGIFVTCSAGQRLINESESVADAAYNTDWYEADISSQILIKMIILRAQKPLYHKMWSVIKSSYITFGQIMKKSYSVLAVLNTLYN